MIEEQKSSTYHKYFDIPSLMAAYKTYSSSRYHYIYIYIYFIPIQQDHVNIPMIFYWNLKYHWYVDSRRTINKNSTHHKNFDIPSLVTVNQQYPISTYHHLWIHIQDNHKYKSSCLWINNTKRTNKYIRTFGIIIRSVFISLNERCIKMLRMNYNIRSL